MKTVKQPDMPLHALYNLYQQSISTVGNLTYKPFYMAKTNLFCGMYPGRAGVMPSQSFFRQEDCLYLHLAIEGLETNTFFAYPISENQNHKPYFVSWLCDDQGSNSDVRDVFCEIYWSHSQWQLQVAQRQAEVFFDAFKAEFTKEVHNLALKNNIGEYNKDQWAEVLTVNEEYARQLLEEWPDIHAKPYTNVVTPDMPLHDIVLYDCR